VRAADLIAQAEKNGASTAVPLTQEDRLVHLRGLVENGEFEQALEAAKTLDIPPQPAFSQARCESDHLIGKALTGLRRWGEGAEKVTAGATGCSSDPQLHAWLLFNAGKYSAADGRQTKAIAFYDELQRLYPKNSLADDARLRAARSYLAAGVPARYVALLQALPEDYPEGDMTMEGVLELALYRIERDDWSGAAQVLERGAKIVRAKDSARGHEYAGTERYFLARCKQELDDEPGALNEFEAIVREVPLSYYMLHAYSRLLEADPKRAKEALSAAQKLATSAPFQFPHREEYATPEFERGMELLRVGETERGQELLAQLGLGPGADDSLLWGIALLYDRAGDAHESHGIARGRLTDWLAHYPAGDWKSPWEIGFPRPYLPIVERESKATGVPEWLIYGVMREESTFRPHVVSHANAYGLMQIIEPTARGIGKKAGLPYSPTALKRPSVNIAIGSRVLKELNRRFASNPLLAIAGYNAGPGRPISWLSERPNVDFDVWVEMIPYRETRRYMKRVLASRAAYAFIYDQENAQTALVLPKRLTPP
jgi:soluble lytic murein transglycosylase